MKDTNERRKRFREICQPISPGAIMASPVDNLVNDDRFSGDNAALFLLYLPLGLVLMCVRLVVGLFLWIGSLVLPKQPSTGQLLSTIACITFGMNVKQRGIRDTKCSLIVANHVSAMDPLAVYYMLGTLSLRKWKMPPFFASALGIKNIAHFQAKQHFAEPSCRAVLVQPEGAPTSGAGLLKFREWAVPLGARAQPLAIKVERMFTKVTVHSALDTSDSVPWSDLLWYLWTPTTTYSLRLLPPVERNPGEGDEEFGERIRKVIADSLEIEATDYTVPDVIECARRGVRHTAPPASGASPGARPDLTPMARQVKEVLPRVPTRDILRDLARTRSVDVTITNFLEEIVPYTPEPIPSSSSQPSTSKTPPSPASAPASAPASFPTDPRTRHMDFQERKTRMIAAARQKYIEKHGLQIDC